MEEGEEALPDEGQPVAPSEPNEVTVNLTPDSLLEFVENIGASHLFTQSRLEHDYDHVSVSQRRNRRKKKEVPPQFEMHSLEPEAPVLLAESNMPSTSDFNRVDSGTVRVQQPVVFGQRVTSHRASFGAGDPPVRRNLPPQLSANPSRPHQSPQRIAVPQRMREPSFSESAPPMQFTYRAADPPPHRAMENNRPMNVGPAAPPRLKAMSPAEFSHLGPGPHGSAPMLVPGRGTRPVVRGKSGSQTVRGKKDELFQDEEALPTTSSITSPNVYMSPRKVHFSESHPPNESPSYVMQPEPSNVPPVLSRSPDRRLSSPVKSPQRMPPAPPPNVVEMQPPAPVLFSPPKARIPVVAEDTLPENIIDDAPVAPPPPPPVPLPRPPQVESHLPPNIAELAIQFMPKNDVPLVGAEREENVKERIAQIAQHLTSGFKPAPQQPPPVAAPPVMSSPSHKGMKSRNVRTIGPSSSGTAPVPPYLMPNPKSRLPGTSPVRTNLDFNSHLKSYKIPSRSDSASRSTLARVNNNSPGKRRGRPKKQNYVFEDDDDDEEEEEQPEEEQEEWPEGTWVTRCICGYEDNYGAMVECEGCKVWQHNICLELDDDAEPKGFRCEVCEPGKGLPISPDDAREQMRKLLRKPRDRRSSLSKKKNTPKRAASPPPLPKSVPKKTIETAVKNAYTKTAKKLLQVSGSDKNAFHGKIPDGCLSKLFVAPNVQGLVANKDIPEGTAVVEIIGNVCLPHEAGATTDSFHHQYVFIYDGFGETSSSEDRICIDARKHSNDGRFVRRSCQPNAAIRHTISGGQTNFVVVTREKATKGTEITLPFDFGHKPTIQSCVCYTLDNNADKCILLRGGFVGPGHRPPVAVKKEATPVVKKNQRTKKEGPPTPAPASGIVPKIGAKDEKSEEESVADNNNKKRNEQTRKRSKTAVVTPRRGSDKEEVLKGDVDKKRSRASENKTVTELQKMAEAVNFISSSERNKPSREERKFMALMSQYNSVTPKSRAKEAEVKKEPKEESGHKRKSSKTEEAPSTSTPETVKRKKDDVEVKEEGAGASSSSIPPPSKKSRDESEQGTVPMKKSILARYEAESKEIGSAKKSRSNERDAGEEEAANALAEMHNGTSMNLQDEMRKGLSEAMETFGKMEYFCLPPDLQSEAKKRPLPTPPSSRHARVRQPEKPFISPLARKPSSPEKAERNSRAKEVKPDSRTKEVKPEVKEEKPEVAKKEEKIVKKEEKTVNKEEKIVKNEEKIEEPPVAPKRKSISIEEYKKRQQESGPSKEEPREARKGFIPTMDEEDIAVTTSLPPIPLPLPESKPLSRLPEIRSMTTRRSPNVRPSTSFVSPVPPPPPTLPVRTRASTSTSEETPKPRLSIADRLSVEFGVGNPSRRSNY